MSACTTTNTESTSSESTAAQNAATSLAEKDPFTVSLFNTEELQLDIPSEEITKNDIKDIQKNLNSFGYVIATDGVVGKETTSVIKRFERDFELPETGEASQSLLAYLNYLNDSKEQGVLFKVSEIQKALIAKQHLKGKADGIPGPITRKAISEFQIEQGLNADGQLTEGLFNTLTAE